MPRKRYWIDPSCDEAAGGNFEAFIIEARHWARRAVERLTSASDTDFARVFNLIMKTPKTDTVTCSNPSFWQQVNGIHPEHLWQHSAAHVTSVLYSFAHSWARTSRRAAADVRIYSSARGLSRWTTRPRNGAVYDRVNHIYFTGDWASLMEGEAFTSWLLPNQPVAGENPSRVTIDISASAWQSVSPHLLSQHDPALLLNNAGDLDITQLSGFLMTRLIFHEFMHARRYLLDDYPRDGETSGWEYCMRRKKGQAATCAESLAMLGLCAALADMRPSGRVAGGFTVDRAWDLIPGGWNDVDLEGLEWEEEEEETMKWNYENGNKSVRGLLTFYEDVTN